MKYPTPHYLAYSVNIWNTSIPPCQYWLWQQKWNCRVYILHIGVTPQPLCFHHLLRVLQLYIQARLISEWARLLRPTIQFFLISTSLYVGLSRVSDYKHHWSDVLAGLLQGAVIAVLTVGFIQESFKLLSAWKKSSIFKSLFSLCMVHWVCGLILLGLPFFCRCSLCPTSSSSQLRQWCLMRKKLHIPVYMKTLQMGTTMAARTETEAFQIIIGPLSLNTEEWNDAPQVFDINCWTFLVNFFFTVSPEGQGCSLQALAVTSGVVRKLSGG